MEQCLKDEEAFCRRQARFQKSRPSTMQWLNDDLHYPVHKIHLHVHKKRHDAKKSSRKKCIQNVQEKCPDANNYVAAKNGIATRKIMDLL